MGMVLVCLFNKILFYRDVRGIVGFIFRRVRVGGGGEVCRGWRVFVYGRVRRWGVRSFGALGLR